MYLTNNRMHGRNDFRAMTSNGRDEVDLTAFDDLDFSGAGGGKGNPPVPEVKLDDAGNPIPPVVEKPEVVEGFEKVLEHVENDVVKGLEESQVKTILESNSGVGFDKDGNIIDTDGKVVKTFEDYKESIADSVDPLKDIKEVEIEGATYQLDDKGNAVDAEGKLFKSREDIIALLDDEGGDDETGYISQISSITGFQATNENGDVVEFDDTVEGLAARETHIIKQEASKMASQEINTFFDKNPDIEEMAKYKKIHGSLKDYGTSKDYTKVVLSTGDDEQYRSIIVEAEMAQGKDEKRAKHLADMLIADGKAKEEAEASLEYLIKKQTDTEASAVAASTQREQAAIIQHNEFVKDVVAVVSTGEANGLTIPEYFAAILPDGSKRTIHRNAIAQLVTEKDQNGNTRYDDMRSSDTVEDKILDSYMRLIGYDFSKLVAQKAAKDKIIKLRSSKKKAGSKVNLIKNKEGVSDSDLDLS